MSVYDGQLYGEIIPLDSEQDLPLFTEADRQAAYRVIRGEAPDCTDAVTNRLEDLQDAGSHQAEFLLGMIMKD